MIKDIFDIDIDVLFHLQKYFNYFHLSYFIFSKCYYLTQ